MNLEHLLQKKQLRFMLRDGVYVVSVMAATSGVEIAKEILETLVDGKTGLFLSGGRTPAELYTQLANEEQFTAGVVGMVDERFGEKFHSQSNELMIQNTGLLRYLSMRGVMFHPILQSEEGIIETAGAYDQQVRSIAAQYQQLIGVLGIGADGHTAGLLPGSSKFKIQNSKLSEHDYVSSYDYPDALYKKRISMTFLGLSMLDYYIILAFGEEKKKALAQMFADGKEEDIPARFYRRKANMKKTILITDQEIEGV